LCYAILLTKLNLNATNSGSEEYQDFVYDLEAEIMEMEAAVYTIRISYLKYQYDWCYSHDS